jgi:phosphonate transport system ATP-binding protein
MTTAPVLELSRVVVRYGPVRALSGVDLTVRPGERIALIGPSGAGKSTVIRLLNGTALATEGSVRVLDVDFAGASSRAVRNVQRRLGTIHQQFDLVDQLRVVHNVNAGRLGSWSLWKSALSLVLPRDVDRARHALERVGIGDKLYERTATLSGGEQQRVAIARVLVQRPAAILADEPIASLDPVRGREVINLLHDISIETGSTLLASLHDVEVALDRFERVIGLRSGMVAFDSSPRELSRDQLDELYALERRQGSA